MIKAFHPYLANFGRSKKNVTSNFRTCMKSSDIRFNIELDDENVPEKIFWKASDTGNKPEETKAISLSIWDQNQKETLRIDLWAKDMPTHEMKRFYIDTIGGLANSLLSSTDDVYMAGEMNKLCERLIEHLKKEYPA